jgi:hypothetical protein
MTDGAITAGHAILIARLQPDDQRGVLRKLAEQRDYAPMSVDELEQFIHRDYFMELDRAAFRQDDGDLLPQAGPCTTCIKHTGAQPGLFADVCKKDSCLDRTCYNAKLDALVARRKEELKGQQVLLVKDDYSASHPKGVLQRYEWNECKKKDAGAKQVLVVDGPGRGRLGWGKPVAQARSGNSIKDKEAYQKQQAKLAEEHKVAEVAERLLLDAVTSAADKARTRNKSTYTKVLRVVTAEFYEAAELYEKEELAAIWGEPMDDVLKARKRIEAMTQFECETFMLRLGLYMVGRFQDIKELKEMAKLLKLDVKNIEREARAEVRTQTKLASTSATSPAAAGTCRVCGCTDDDCSQCMKETGEPCHWVDEAHTLCSACEDQGELEAEEA